MDEFTSDDAGMSPVIGVALLVVIVAALAAATAGMLVGFESKLQDPAPVFANEGSVNVTLQGDDAEHTLEFVHDGGQSVQAEALRVQVGSGSNTQTITLGGASVPVLSDGRWSAGERLDLDLDESVVCSGDGDAAQVSLVYRNGDTSHLLSDRTVPVERGQFVIRDDAVEPTAEYTAEVTFLGTGWSSPSYDAPVDVSVGVDGSEVTSWEDVTDTNDAVGSYSLSRQAAGTSLSVSARGKTSRYGDWRTTSGSENSEYLVVLRDGDPVPNYDAGAGQQDVAEYAEPYIEDGTISLDDNQALYLFDFNRRGTDDETADYQDAVVLVSFFTQETTGVEVHENRHGRSAIVCSPETRSGSAGSG